MAARRVRFAYDIRVALGEAQHPLDEVDAVDLLGDRVFDLEAGVDLQEVRLRARRVVHELHRARRAVADRPAQILGGRGQLLTDVRREPRGGGLLQDLLVAALEGAVAVAEGHHPAPAVAEDLHLDMTGVLHEAFEEDTGGGEGRGGDPLHPLPGVGEFVDGSTGRHADTAATAGRLEHHGIADAVGRRHRRRQIGEQPGAGGEGYARGLGGRAGGVLRAEQLQLLGGRADEDDPRVLAAPGEPGVLGEEAVAGVDGPGPGVLGGLQNQVGVEVRLLGGRGSQPYRRVGEADMGR